MAIAVAEKFCPKCGETKALSEFYKDKTRKDGVYSYCKPCSISRVSIWQKANKDKVNANYRKNYSLHLESSQEKRRERVQKFYNNHKEEEIQRTSDYNKANLHIKVASEQRRRIRKKDNGIFAVSSKEIQHILSLPCVECASTDRVTLDHIIPISKGGRHSIGNLQPLCSRCNSSKNDKVMTEWRYRRGSLRRVK